MIGGFGIGGFNHPITQSTNHPISFFVVALLASGGVISYKSPRFDHK